MGDFQDWNTVILKKNTSTQPRVAKTNADLNAAFRSGSVEAVKKVSHKGVPSNARALDEETEDFHHATLSHEFKIALQKARTAKGLNQTQLAQKLSVKVNVINDYENGKVIPNPQVISQLNRALDTVLPKIVKPKKVADDL